MLKNAFDDWRNVLGKIISILQMVGVVIVGIVLAIITIGLILLFIIFFTDVVGIIHFGTYIPDHRTYQEKQMDEYIKFETECLSREYTKDQCLNIWGKDND